ncbi:kynurenine--oxoglutarate transaminase 3 [Octopus sinensis]|uniref:Kynurenine--oxoglutarate transaminase 3 n=1 Tax=Octopus sinensis TaxID=2607531 RepID=A0A6P7U7B5_9MOLL|nr:kynurenine--oxoglutarate transaminase 3 [Octopus sinensis]
MSTKLSLAKKYYGSEKNVWVEMSKLAVDYNAVNLGQGFPDFKPPPSATNAMIEAASNKNHLLHQYTRGFGQHRLIDILSKVYSPIMGRTIDPFKEILVSVGGYGALYSCINGFLNPGDEVRLNRRQFSLLSLDQPVYCYFIVVLVKIMILL